MFSDWGRKLVNMIAEDAKNVNIRLEGGDIDIIVT